MYLERRFHKHSLKSVQLHSEAMRFRKHEAPLVRKASKADAHPKECQFPIRDATKQELRAGSETWKCMDPTKPQSSYCEHHHQICYVKAVLTEAE